MISPVGIYTWSPSSRTTQFSHGHEWWQNTVKSNPAHQKSRLCAEEVPKKTRSLLSGELLKDLMVFQDSHLTFDPLQSTFPRLPKLLLALPIYEHWTGQERSLTLCQGDRSCRCSGCGSEGHGMDLCGTGQADDGGLAQQVADALLHGGEQYGGYSWATGTTATT